MTSYKPCAYGLSALFGALLLGIASNAPLVSSFGVDSYRIFLLGGLSGSALACIAFLLKLLHPIQGSWSNPFSARRTLLFTALSVFSLDIPGFISSGHTGMDSLVVGLFGAVFGASTSLLSIAWGRAYAREDPSMAIRATALSFLISAAFLAFGLVIPSGPPSLSYESLLLLVSGATIAISLRSESLEKRADRFDAPHSAESASAAKRLDTAWQPLLLSIIVAWVFGLIWDPSLTPNPGENPAWFGISIVAAQVIACAIYILVFRLKGLESFRSTAFTVILPLAAACLLLIPSLAGDVFVPGSLVLNTLSWLCFSLIILVTWSTLLTIEEHDPNMNSGIFAACLTFCSIAALLGMLLVRIVGSYGQVISLILFVSYFVSMAMRPQRIAKTIRDESTYALDEKRFENRCTRIAHEYGLSPRERDVLPLIGRGYSQAYIASELVISQNTVHTHVRNIYGKLGVSSKEELISFILSEADECGRK